MHRLRMGLAILTVICTAPACAVHRVGFSRMADAISQTASTFASDSDPEFVRTGAPSTLKMVEMLLEQDPGHQGLLQTACSGFTQYAYAFLHVDAELAEAENASQARELHERAIRMYDRARDYCLQRLETTVSGSRQALLAGRRDILSGAGARDVPALYWLGIAWGGSLSLAPNRVLRVGELVTIRAVLQRALELDAAWGGGAIHEAMIALEGLPVIAGGSAERARAHFDQAVSLSGGQSAFAYVTMAASVAQPAKDRAEFERLLNTALAIDVNKRPALRLANLIAQKRARFLLSRTEQLF